MFVNEVFWRKNRIVLHVYRSLDIPIIKSHSVKPLLYLFHICICLFEVLEALNMEEMMSTISCWMKNPTQSLVSTHEESTEEIPILIIEGFLLFHYK